jgi:hypothetical protein
MSHDVGLSLFADYCVVVGDAFRIVLRNRGDEFTADCTNSIQKKKQGVRQDIS